MPKKPKHKKEKLIIGWNETVSLPKWNIKKLKAKIDTGARSSALHVDHIETLPNHQVSFWVVLDKKTGKKIKVRSRISRTGHVKSSHGETTHRFFVTTDVLIGSIQKKIELNLVDRGKMNYRMLLGRTALGGDFIVDVAHTQLLSKKKRLKRSL